MTEADLVYDLRLRLNRGPVRLFRMQSGNFELADGRHISVGTTGLSDLIGWRSFVIKPEDVGKVFACFVALECKSETGRATREQLAFLDSVLSTGGLAGVVRSVEEAQALLGLIS